MAKVILNELKGSAPFWVCLCFSIALITFGALMPPMGVVDGSILTAVGEVFAYATLWVVFKAVMNGIDAKLTHGNTEVLIGDITNPKSNQDETTTETDCEA